MLSIECGPMFRVSNVLMLVGGVPQKAWWFKSALLYLFFGIDASYNITRMEMRQLGKHVF